MNVSSSYCLLGRGGLHVTSREMSVDDRLREVGEVLLPDSLAEVSGEAYTDLKADMSKQIDAFASTILYMFVIKFAP